MNTLLLLTALSAVTVGSDALECGMRKVQPISASVGRIEGGVAQSWPWQVALCMKQESGSCKCGGTIVGPNHILTAAHCLGNLLPHMLTIKVNTHRLGDNGREFQVGRIIQHPHWDHKTIRNDIALVELIEMLEFTDTVSPICLPYAEKGNTLPKKANVATVVGWGLTKENGENSETLQQVNLPFVSRKECKKTYKNVFETSLCVGGVKGKSPCNNDSGGPAMKETNGRWYQYGVLSFGEGCGRGKPDVFTRVSAYCDFFLDTIGYDICVAGN